MKRQSKSNPSSKPASKLNPNGADFAENLRSLQIKIGNTPLIAYPNDPADLEAAREMAQALMQPSHVPNTAHSSLISAGPVPLASGAAKVQSTPSAPISGNQRNLAGLTLDELITRYATCKRGANEPKSKYEYKYEKIRRKFERWVHAKKNQAPSRAPHHSLGHQ